MNDQLFSQRIVAGDSEARADFSNRYFGYIIRGPLKKCKKNCVRRNCPLGYGFSQQNLQRANCDEFANLFAATLEHLFEGLKYYTGDEPLDKWVDRMTQPNGSLVKQARAKHLSQKLKLTGRVRIPYRFRRWSEEYKAVYENWLRGKSVQKIEKTVNRKEKQIQIQLNAEEVGEILSDILVQLEEAGLLAKLEEGKRLQQFEQLERPIYETKNKRASDRPSTVEGHDTIPNDVHTNQTELESVAVQQLHPVDRAYAETFRCAFGDAFANLPPTDRRLLELKYDQEWTLEQIAQESYRLGLGHFQDYQQAFQKIESILSKMIRAINRTLKKNRFEGNLELKALKRVFKEVGIP